MRLREIADVRNPGLGVDAFQVGMAREAQSGVGGQRGVGAAMVAMTLGAARAAEESRLQ